MYQLRKPPLAPSGFSSDIQGPSDCEWLPSDLESAPSFGSAPPFELSAALKSLSSPEFLPPLKFSTSFESVLDVLRSSFSISSSTTLEGIEEQKVYSPAFEKSCGAFPLASDCSDHALESASSRFYELESSTSLETVLTLTSLASPESSPATVSESSFSTDTLEPSDLGSLQSREPSPPTIFEFS